MTIAKTATVILSVEETQPVGNPAKFIQLFHRKIGIPDLPDNTNNNNNNGFRLCLPQLKVGLTGWSK